MPAHQYQEYSELLTQDLFGILKENPDTDLSELKITPDVQGESPVPAKVTDVEPEIDIDNEIENAEEQVNPEETE